VLICWNSECNQKSVNPTLLHFQICGKNEDYDEDKEFPFSDVISLQVHFKQKGSNEFN